MTTDSTAPSAVPSTAPRQSRIVGIVMDEGVPDDFAAALSKELPVRLCQQVADDVDSPKAAGRPAGVRRLHYLDPAADGGSASAGDVAISAADGGELAARSSSRSALCRSSLSTRAGRLSIGSSS